MGKCLAHQLFPAEYETWFSMKARCHNKNREDWKFYGGRGIGIDDPRWNYFESFIQDMGLKPNRTYTLERIDNNKGYSKENCKWATKTEQNRNQSTTILNQKLANEIRKLYKIGIWKQSELAKIFKVNQSHISQIVLNKIWREE
jgi:predicted XRE-type DNA-binding protein